MLQCRWGAACPFCRSPKPDNNDYIEQLNKRIKAKPNDAGAYFQLETAYHLGNKGWNVAQDQEKGLQLLLCAGELGSAKSY
jgi:hypothetical protein